MENETRGRHFEWLWKNCFILKLILKVFMNHDPKLIFLKSLMMNLRTSHIICGKQWIIHRENMS
jgi:hypothetical protein